jgi:tetratricopeptide (TPR) repeat protein
MLSWLLFFGFYLYLGFKSIFLNIEDNFINYLLSSSFFVSIYLWTMSIVYIPSTVIFILTLFFTGLFFASLYASGIISVSERKLITSPVKGFAYSLLIIVSFFSCLFLGYELIQNSKSLWYYQKSSYALNTVGDADLSEKYMQSAVALEPLDVYYRALSEIELVKLNKIVSQDVKKVKPELIQQEFKDTLSSAISAGLSAKNSDQSNYLNWIALGRVYDAVSLPDLNIAGAYDNAELSYNEALKRNPKNPGIFVLLARLAATKKDYNKAENYALQATKIKSNYLDAYFILSQIEVANQNINKAIDAVKASSVIDPTNPATFFQLGLLKYNIKDYSGAIESLEHATNMTPEYANAKYFLGLSYEAIGEHDKAIKEFQDLKVTNPDNADVDTILTNLLVGKSLFANTSDKKPEKGKSLPLKEKQ